MPYLTQDLTREQQTQLLEIEDELNFTARKNELLVNLIYL